MTFTKNGERYSVFVSAWTGTWIVGGRGIAYRTLCSAGGSQSQS